MQDNEIQGLCTGTAFEKTPDGYNFITAGHCYYEAPQNVTYEVAAQVGDVGIPATILKAHLDDNLDMMILHVPTNLKIPTIPLDLKSNPNIGDDLLIISFGDALGKQLNHTVISTSLLDDMCDACAGKFALPIPEAKGASGSATISMKSHKIVGIVVLSSQFNSMIQPIADYSNLSGIQPKEAPDTGSVIEKLLHMLGN